MKIQFIRNPIFYFFPFEKDIKKAVIEGEVLSIESEKEIKENGESKIQFIQKLLPKTAARFVVLLRLLPLLLLFLCGPSLLAFSKFSILYLFGIAGGLLIWRSYYFFEGWVLRAEKTIAVGVLASALISFVYYFLLKMTWVHGLALWFTVLQIMIVTVAATTLAYEVANFTNKKERWYSWDYQLFRIKPEFNKNKTIMAASVAAIAICVKTLF